MGPKPSQYASGDGMGTDMLVVAICSTRAIARAARLTGTLRLDRRARHRTVGAEHATIFRLRPQAGSAAGAFVIESAGVRRHGLGFGYAAARTSNDRREDHAFGGSRDACGGGRGDDCAVALEGASLRVR